MIDCPPYSHTPKDSRITHTHTYTDTHVHTHTNTTRVSASPFRKRSRHICTCDLLAKDILSSPFHLWDMEHNKDEHIGENCGKILLGSPGEKLKPNKTVG